VSRPEPDPLHLEAPLALEPAWTEKILVGFLRAEIERTGTERAVLGLSGGLDSAVSAHLAARALGADRVHAVLMPYRTSSADSLAHAQEVVADLGIGSETVDITPMVDGFRRAAGETDPLRLGNVMARCRMIVLYDRSAARRALVVGTSNKTEILLGYGTLFGDLASAVNPIGDLYKTQVRAMARHLGVPASILEKPPSADLWPDQSDEDELGFSYDDADRVLALWVDGRIAPERIVEAGYDRALVARIRSLVVRSQFKRRLPVIAKVSPRSVGWDFRYPRDWNS
jgi:NAD+ synthase